MARAQETGILAYREFAYRAAKDFHYKKEVLEKIRAAKNDAEIDRIMRDARREKFG